MDIAAHCGETHTTSWNTRRTGRDPAETHAQTLTLAEHLHNPRKAVFANFNKYFTKKTFEKSMEKGGRKWWLGYFRKAGRGRTV